MITGGPGVGKTTTLLELEKKGHVIIPEAAREIIDQEKEKENGILPWTNLYEFQKLVLQRQLVREQIYTGQKAFCDRGLIDGFAYCRLGGIQPPEELRTVSHSYSAIFLLSPLEHYINDAERKEDSNHARKIHEAIARVYQEHGYQLIHIPVLIPQERAEFILSHVQ